MTSWISDTYRLLRGTQENPTLRPGSWDIPTTSGFTIELDEEQHFNRYRSATLRQAWAWDLPWRTDYLELCEDFEPTAIRSRSGGGSWSSSGSERQFGTSGPNGVLEGPGSARWKQRALYDAMKDALAATGEINLVRRASGTLTLPLRTTET
ncbi:MAG: DUF7255 family protein [Pseudoclavibacter sp.]